MDRLPFGAIPLETIAVSAVHPDEGVAAQIAVVRRKKIELKTRAVKIVITGTDGTVIADLWTRDQFLTYFKATFDALTDA